MGSLKYLFLHCSATPEDSKTWNAARLKKFHTDPKEKGGRGWDRPGYSVVIEQDGKVVRLRKWNGDNFVDADEVTWGVGPEFNAVSVHICYVGGMTPDGKLAKNTLKGEQLKSVLATLKWYLEKHPQIKILGHNQVANKWCPSLWVPDLLTVHGFPVSCISKEDRFNYSTLCRNNPLTKI